MCGTSRGSEGRYVHVRRHGELPVACIECIECINSQRRDVTVRGFSENTASGWSVGSRTVIKPSLRVLSVACAGNSPAVSFVCRKCTGALTEHTGACSLTAAGRLATNRSKAAGSASIAKPCRNGADCNTWS